MPTEQKPTDYATWSITAGHKGHQWLTYRFLHDPKQSHQNNSFDLMDPSSDAEILPEVSTLSIVTKHQPNNFAHGFQVFHLNSNLSPRWKDSLDYSCQASCESLSQTDFPSRLSIQRDQFRQLAFGKREVSNSIQQGVTCRRLRAHYCVESLPADCLSQDPPLTNVSRMCLAD